MHLAVIIPAAGSSRRYADADPLGGGRSKLDEDLGGRPVLQRTVELFTKVPEVSLIVVAGPAPDDAFAQFKLRHSDKLGLLGVKICRGGATHRYETVRNALKEVPDDGSITHVAVHDAARPCASEHLIERIIRAAGEGGHKAVIPALDVGDTLKRVCAERLADTAPDPLAAILGTGATGAKSESGIRLVEQTVDRANLVAVQTPQVFEIKLLRRAYIQADLTSTDDSQLIERLGEKVAVVDGEATNIKITRPSDLQLARMILGVRGPIQREVHKRF